MTFITIEQRSGGHFHEVQLEDTFDFVNTLEYDANEGTPNEHLQTAEQAVEANADVEDKSAYYIELGLARQGAGDVAGAREAFEMAREGAWSGWAEHYLRELDGGGATDAGTGG